MGQQYSTIENGMREMNGVAPTCNPDIGRKTDIMPDLGQQPNE
jgi:hypothetical protein